MNPIAIWYHVRISGGAHPDNALFPGNPDLDEAHALSVVGEQVGDLRESGLLDGADNLVIGINGGPNDFRSMVRLIGHGAAIFMHGPEASSELPTMARLEEWAKESPGWDVLYLHSKGVSWPKTKPGWELRQAWRRCLMRNTVQNWTDCVQALRDGYDMAGAHWLTAEKYPQSASALPRPIWGGNFWWTTSDYLAQLPPLISLERDMDLSWRYRYQAEQWPTSGKLPRVKDFVPDHWPGLGRC